jgi:hypothetical protein
MSQFAPLINGVQYSGASVRVNILGVSLAGIKSIDFKMTREVNNIHGTGSNVNSRSFGKKNYAGKVAFLMADLTALENASPDNDPTQLPPFSVIVTYMEGVNIKSYTLLACQFTEWGVSTKTDDKEIAVEMPFVYADQKRTR